MPLSRRPQQTFLSGLGMAGAVLASVVLTFTVASGIITYSLTSQDPMPSTSSAALVLELRAADPGVSPLVLHAARAQRTPARVSVPARRTATAHVRGLADGALSASSRSRDSGVAPNIAAPGSGQQSGAGDIVRRPVGKALGDTTQAVGATTDSLGRRLQATTDELVPGLAPVRQQTGELVQAIVDRTSAALERLLRKL